MTPFHAAIVSGDVVIVPRGAVSDARRSGWWWGVGNAFAVVGAIVVFWWVTR